MAQTQQEKVLANRANVKRWRERNKDKANERNRKYYQSSQWMKNRKQKMQLFRDTIKLHYGCCNPECRWEGEFSPCMLDFHHVGEKKFSLGKCNYQKSIATFCEEINKCTVLCSNCHRLATWENLDCSNFTVCEVNSDMTIKENNDKGNSEKEV